MEFLVAFIILVATIVWASGKIVVSEFSFKQEWKEWEEGNENFISELYEARRTRPLSLCYQRPTYS